MTVTLTEQGLEIDEQRVPVYSGSVHYWRLERDKWPVILDQVQSLGFGMVETYIPWSVHEIAPGTFDWGSVDPRKDIEAFCQLCEARGLYLMVRPGPLINAEMTDFGFPEWVLLDPEVQAHTAVGSIHLDAAWGFHPPRPFPVPSYASPKFYEAVGRWFDAVCPVIERHMAPGGCIVAVQSDNESCYLFHDQPYATDYSPASIAAYQRFLCERYETIVQLNAVYGQDFRGFDAIAPPRDCQIRTAADVPWHRDWVEYKEHYLHQGVVQIAQMLRARGIKGIPIFHDVAFQYSTPLDIARMEADPAIDWVGMNLYRSPQKYVGTIQRIRYLAGTTRLPFVPEFGSGIWSHHSQTPTPVEQEFTTLAALMHGMRAVNFYMLVERERWQGSPITRHGAYRPGYAEFYQRLSIFLQRYPLGTFHRQTQVVVLLNYDLGRYKAMASTLHYAHIDLLRLPEELEVVDLDLGFRWDVAHEADQHRSDNWLGKVCAQLKQQQLDYDIADSHIDPRRLQQYAITCIPTVDFMDAADQQQLLGYVAAGGCLIIGPGVPYLDSNLRPCSVLNAVVQEPGEVAFGCGHIIWVSADALATTLAQRLPSPTIQWDAPEVDVVEQVGEKQRLIFIANPADREQHVTITFDMPRHLLPVWGGSAKATRDAQLTIDLDPYTIQIWEAQHD
ncbi:MAG TPA: beta-galactosidase [Ktedonobacteraceae bacterium]|nr:beta-galactosidase [Ktedonobacteraceae bacterium]